MRATETANKALMRTVAQLDALRVNSCVVGQAPVPREVGLCTTRQKAPACIYTPRTGCFTGMEADEADETDETDQANEEYEAAEPISPSQAHFGVALAMHVLLLSDQYALSSKCSRSSMVSRFHEVKYHVFSEAIRPLSAEPWVYVSVGAPLQTICQLTAAWSIQQQPEILVQALMLVEMMVSECPGLLTATTFRPLLLTAVMLSVKLLVDDERVTIEFLQQVGFDALDRARYLGLEAAFLRALNFRIGGATRQGYNNYAIELRKLAKANVHELRGLVPEIVAVVERMDHAAGPRPTPALNDSSPCA